MADIQLYNQDCKKVLETLADNSVDSMVTDPPAGIGFMGKDWDKDKGGRKQWCAWLESIMTECLRVLKPGAHALVWSLPRTSHWTAIALEDAGFEIRDCVYHIFGSGFPKSMDIGKAIDSININGHSNTRGFKNLKGEKGISALGFNTIHSNNDRPSDYNNQEYVKKVELQSPEAKQWEGWGTALKPAVEHWWLVRKPISEKSIAENILKWGTGGINIDACRVEGLGAKKWETPKGGIWATDSETKSQLIDNEKGRFPAHLIHDGSEEVLMIFPTTKSGAMKPEYNVGKGSNDGVYVNNQVLGKYKIKPFDKVVSSSIGSAARFFYCAKPSPEEKTIGLEGFETKVGSVYTYTDEQGNGVRGMFKDREKKSQNPHPTVKAQALMEYFVRLITPPQGIVLDPFMGSGSTGVAAINSEMGFIGIEIDKEEGFFEVAKARINHAQAELPKTLKAKIREARLAEMKQAQVNLFNQEN